MNDFQAGEALTDNLSGSDEFNASPVVSPGSQLARRREELNLTVEQVAGQLNLAPRQIEAIEADNYAALPGMVSVRGFIRSYAKLMRIDPEPLLAAIAPAAAPLRETRQIRTNFAEKPFSEHRLSFGRRGAKPIKLALYAGALAVVIGVAVVAPQLDWATLMPQWLLSKNEEPVVPAQVVTDSLPQEDGRKVELLPTPVVPVDSAPAAPASTANGGVAATMVQSAAAISSASLPAPEAAVTVKAETAAAEAPAAMDALVLKINEKSWVELKRPDGTILLSREFAAGTVESVKIKGEAVLTVGNAAGVEANLRGAPLDLSSRARNNVARLNVK